MALYNNTTSLVDSKPACSIGEGLFQLIVQLPVNKSIYEGQLKIYFHGAAGMDQSIGGINIYDFNYSASENAPHNGLSLDLAHSIKNTYQTSDFAGYKIDSAQVISSNQVLITISTYGSHPPFATPLVTAILSDFNVQYNSFSTTSSIMVTEFKTNVSAKIVKDMPYKWSLAIDLPGNTDFYLGELELVFRGETGMDASIGGCFNYLIAWATSNKVLFTNKGRIITKTSDLTTQYETSDFNGYHVHSIVVPSPNPGGQQYSRRVIFNFSSYGPNPPLFPPVCTLVFRGLPFITKYESGKSNETLFQRVPRENYATVRTLEGTNLKKECDNTWNLDINLPKDFNFFNGTIEFDITGLKAIYKVFGTTSEIKNLHANGKKIQLVKKTTHCTKSTLVNSFDITSIQFIAQNKIRLTIKNLGAKPSKVFPEISAVYKGYWNNHTQTGSTVQHLKNSFEVNLLKNNLAIDNLLQVGCLVYLN